MSDYAVAAGIVQFDVVEKEVADQDIREVTIKTFTAQKLIKITLWPEFAGVEVKKGDTVFVDGKFKVSLGQAKNGGEQEYFNISATQISVVPGAEKIDTRSAGSAAGRSVDSSSDTPNF